MNEDKVSLNDIIRKAAEDSIEYAPGYFNYEEILDSECEEKRYDAHHIEKRKENLYSTTKHLLNVVHFAVKERHGKYIRYVIIRTVKEATNEVIEIEHSGIYISTILNKPEYNTKFTIAEDVSELESGLRKVVQEELNGQYTLFPNEYNGIRIKLPIGPSDKFLHPQ